MLDENDLRDESVAPVKLVDSASWQAPRSVTPLRVLAFALLYFGASTAITLYNKFMYTHAMKFPLTLIVFQQAGIAVVALVFAKACSLRLPDTFRRTMWANLPAGVCMGADIALSNVGFSIVTLSFYQIVKSQVPAWVLVLSLLTGLTTASAKLLGSFALIVVGTVLAVAHSAHYNTAGLILLSLASLAGGAKLCYFQHLYGAHGAGTSPVLLAGSIALPVLITVLPFAAFFEFTTFFRRPAAAVGLAMAWIAGGVVLALLLVVSEMLLAGKTTAVTAVVVAIGKEVLMLALAMAALGDHVTLGNVIGLGIVFAGIGLFTADRMQRSRTAEAAQAWGGGFVLLDDTLSASDGAASSGPDTDTDLRLALAS